LPEIRNQLRHALSRTVVFGCLLCSSVQADETSAMQEPPEPQAQVGNPSSAESSSPIVYAKGKQSFGEVRTFGLAIADVDLDGDNDLFIANYIGPSRLWLNDGDGLFTDSHQRFEASSDQRAHDVAIADFNGDSHSDIFLVCHNAPSRVFLNDGSGEFVDSQQNIGAAGDSPTSVVLGDVDSDGDIDAFIIYARKPNRLWVNGGNGLFTRSDAEYGGRTAKVMTLADFNGDKFPDLFFGFLEKTGEVWFNDGSGNFRDTEQALGDQVGCDCVVAGDIDADGDTDLVISNFENGIGVWFNQDGTGIFAEEGSRFSPGTIKTEVLDADADGDLDLIASHMETGNRLWLNRGSGQFTPTDQYPGNHLGFLFRSREN
jgi:hypothetical protein